MEEQKNKNNENNITINISRSISTSRNNMNNNNNHNNHNNNNNNLTPVRSNLRTFMRMITGASVSTNIVKNKNNNKRMLTSGQLSDLFRRLDKDGNGELDLEEFTQIISKLKINASEEFITRIFQKVNLTQSGTLTLQEFVSAYQMIYTRPSVIGDSEARDNVIKRRASEFICATRYGTDSLGRNIFEMILGHVVDMSDGPHLKLNERRIYKVEGYTGEINDLPYDIVPGFNKSLPDLNEMITKDSISNQSIKSKLYWWIDISMAKVSASRVDKYVAAFGLPNDSKFRSAFSQYGTLLRKDEKSHVYAANGNSNLGGVSSLNFFIQALWISQLPIVHHIPAWLDNAIENYLTPALKVSFKNYYYSRFAFFFNSSSLNSGLHQDEITAVENAQVISNRLQGNDGFEDMEDEEMIWKKNPTNILLPAPIIHRNKSKYQAQPSWLLSNSDLRKRPPKLRCEDLSIHILHQGHDPSAVVTIRQIDDESSCYSSPNISKLGSTIVEDSKKGILGRILTGIRSKIVKNLCSDGIVQVGGELTDSPAALASIIITLTQSYSMNTLGSLVTWLNLLSTEIGDLAVSKHSNHSKELITLIHHLLDYAMPTYDYMNNLYTEGAQIIAEEARIEAENMAASAAASTSAGGIGSSISESDDDTYTHDNNVGNDKLHSHDSYDTEESEDPLKAKLRTRTISSGTRLSHLIRNTKDGSYHARGISQAQLSVAILPSACQNIPISFIYARPFLSNNPIRYLSILVDGDESLEVKGIKYWNEQLNSLSVTATKLKEDIRLSLDDKRNFFNFILTMVTVYLAPLTILCGYWGMNFTNMTELKPENNPDIPGIQIMWAISFVVYGFFLVMSVHFRIFYSAT